MIQNPLNFTGAKGNLLPQLLPLFPDHSKFLDLFGGSGVVGVNSPATTLHFNDSLSQLVQLQQWFYYTPLDLLLGHIDQLIRTYRLNRKNKEGYCSLRKVYNAWPASPPLYVLVCHSFSNYLRFNSKNEFNVPFGGRSFNSNMREKLIAYVKELKSKDVVFTSLDFRAFTDIQPDTFVFCDPPYTAGVAVYNTGWTPQDDSDLFYFLDSLNEKGVKWGMTNVLENNGQSNDLLEKWRQGYSVVPLENSYYQSNYHRKNKGTTIEVYITNV